MPVKMTDIEKAVRALNDKGAKLIRVALIRNLRGGKPGQIEVIHISEFRPNPAPEYYRNILKSGKLAAHIAKPISEGIEEADAFDVMDLTGSYLDK